MHRSPSNRKSARIDFYVTAIEKRCLEACAKQAGLSVAKYMHTMALEKRLKKPVTLPPELLAFKGQLYHLCSIVSLIIYNFQSMNEQIITDVLNDILQELKQSNQSLKTLQTTIGELQEKTSGFEQKLTGQQVIAPPADTTPIQELTGRAINTIQQDVKKQLGVISAIVEAQPKNVIKQWRLSFFPDNDINGSFKHLINKITMGMICFALIAAGYKLGLHYLDRPVSASQAPQTFGSVTPGPAEIKNKLDTLYKKRMRKRRTAYTG